MKRLVFLPKAEADIDQIYDYTEGRWGFEKAEAYTYEIRDACRSLAGQQTRGRRLERLRRDYFALPCGSHFIVYRETELQIIVIRILHQRMNLQRHL